MESLNLKVLLERVKPFAMGPGHPYSTFQYAPVLLVIKAIEALGFGNWSMEKLYEHGAKFQTLYSRQLVGYVYLCLTEYFLSNGSMTIFGSASK